MSPVDGVGVGTWWVSGADGVVSVGGRGWRVLNVGRHGRCLGLKGRRVRLAGLWEGVEDGRDVRCRVGFCGREIG